MPNPSRPAPPVTWADLFDLRNTHGVRPTNEKPAKSARVLHEAYAAWEEGQGLKPGRGYLMPLDVLTGQVRQRLRANDQFVQTAELRALVVNALNHPRSGLEIRVRPYRERAA